MLELGQAQVSALRFSTQRSQRTPRLIRYCDPELWIVGLVRGGELGLEQERNTARYGAGDLILYDTSRPFDASVLSTEEPARVVLLQLPRAALQFPEPSLRALVARRLPAGGPGALLGSFLRGLAEQAGALGTGELDRLGSAAAALAAAFFAGLTDSAGSLPAQARAGALRRSIRDHVVRHLHDSELSPAAIARAHHISVRYLHHLFRQDGQSVGAFVREQRLDRCRTDLADPRLTALSVAEIGARWGLRDSAVFSRTFKNAYGVPPGEYRRQRVP
jgi:AraC-like DNA-binding protein